MDQRTGGLLAAIAGAVLLVAGALSSAWVVGEDYGIRSRLGLLSLEVCGEAESCERVGLDELASGPSAPERMGRYRGFALGTLVAGMLAAVAALVTAGFALARRFVERGIQPSSLALIFSALALIAAVLTLSSQPYRGWGTGSGFMMFGLGAAAALLGAILLGRLRAPVGDDEF